MNIGVKALETLPHACTNVHMSTKPPLRLTRLIKQATASALTINRLAELINQANEEAGTGCRVNRKLLGNLRDCPEKVGLTWCHLVALHTYFRRHGASLQQLPILETRGVFEVMADVSRLVFMLGARPRREEQRTDLSHWDRRSQSDLQAQASMQSVHPKLQDEDVLWRSPVDPAAIGNESWHRILDADQSSVISIGSPLAALSSEVMLARMFGVKPFATPRFTPGRSVPFCFVWLHKLAEHFNSAFGLSCRELQADYPELAQRVHRNEATAFILGDEVHETPTTGNEWTMYGIIAAQRRAAGNVWLVVSGLHGPATYGAATMVKQITAELPLTANRHSKVLWVPIKVHVRARTPGPNDGDVREVMGAEFASKPRFWPEEK